MSRTALILTLGGTAEPLAKSINAVRPNFVCYLASQDSLNKLGEVLALLEERPPRDRKVITADHQDFAACYEAALACLKAAREEDFSAEETIIDPTGGTKPMSVALAAAAAPLGCRFQYVGGTQRAKDNTGQVVSGYETVILQDNFLDRFAAEESRQIALFCNTCRYGSARVLAQRAVAKVRPERRAFFLALATILEAYELWDRFDHWRALNVMRKGLHDMEQYLAIRGEDGGATIAGIRANLAFLEKLGRVSGGKEPDLLHIADLLANARRRAVEKAYDDAVARLYRAVEMRAQAALAARGIKSGDVRPEQIPEELRAEYRSRHTDRQGRIRLPLYASYRLLAALDDPTGAIFIAEKRADQLMEARNSSILAHGLHPVNPEVFEGLFRLALELTGVPESELPVMPEFSL